MAVRNDRSEIGLISRKLSLCAQEVAHNSALSIKDARLLTFQTFSVLIISQISGSIEAVDLKSPSTFLKSADTAHAIYKASIFSIDSESISICWPSISPILQWCYGILASIDLDLPLLLGTIYESLVLSERPNIRGTFYTPPDLVNFMVRRALEDKGANTILDPSCGCGVFLLESARFLRNAVPTVENALQIIERRLFGIDTDPIAVQITRLALQLDYIIFADSFSERTVAIPDLSSQIIHANALINCNDLIDDEDTNEDLKQRLKSVNLAELPEQFTTGFDCIICNPPYGISRNEQISVEENRILRRRYHLQRTGKINKYMLFIARCYELLAHGGIMVLVVPNAWLGIHSGNAIRRLLLEDGALDSIWQFDQPLFPGLGVEAIVFRAFKNSSTKNFNLIQSKSIVEMDSASIQSIPISHCLATKDKTIPLFWSASGASLVSDICSDARTIGSSDSPFLPIIALQAYALGRGSPPQTSEIIRNHVFHSMEPSSDSIPYLKGSDIFRYRINWSGSFLRYGPWLAEFQPIERYHGPRVIVREILGAAPYLLHASYTDAPFAYNRSALHIIGREGDSDPILMRALTAILNSRLGSVVIRLSGKKSQRSMFPKLVAEDLRNFPLPSTFRTVAPAIAELTKEIEFAFTNNSSKKMETIQREIDIHVAQAYGVTLQALEGIKLV